VELPPIPKTFKHAISVAQGLKIRYRWMDSLCITQDSEADWEKECALMKTVYKYNFCNIGATLSNTSDGGL
ncbi:uncharacterized protein A1O5_07071, partial [Cladophialophora psammophila CBS 110553]